MIAIIDYKAGNTCSVQNALKRLNATYQLTDDADVIRSADKVIFPGVGHAKAAMNALNDKNLVPVIQSLKQPLLGICLGMQLLCVKSEEADTKCLDIIPLEVRRFSSTSANEKVPHMGWNTLDISDDKLFRGIGSDNHCYFVHSYYVPMSDFTISKTHYIHEFSSSIKRDNFTGVQFHPEKSGKVGAKIIRNFLES